jgi:hypothetical protein
MLVVDVETTSQNTLELAETMLRIESTNFATTGGFVHGIGKDLNTLVVVPLGCAVATR